VSTQAPTTLRDLVGRLETLAERRLETGPRSEASAARALRLRDHLTGHLRVRARSLDAPLLVLLLGPTGAGKSTLFNTIAGRPMSQTGVLRPTTRVAVVLVHPEDRAPLLEGTLAGIGQDRIRLVEDAAIAHGLALVDAPDLDSIEHANRELADQLVEAADLCLFVTTATRYADRVPWLVLGRIRERGLPLVVVVNRMPPDEADRTELLLDVARLFEEAGIRDTSGDEAVPVELVGVAEGEVELEREALRAASITPITERIDHLREDRDARIELAARTLAGSLAGLGPLIDQIADDCEHEAIDVEALRRTAVTAYERELVGLRATLAQGTFLREEALRHWQSFVGADQVTRFFSNGIGRIRGAIASVLRPMRAPVAEVREATTDDLVALARVHAAEAARRTAASWADEPSVSDRVAAEPGLWVTSSDFDERLRGRIEEWIGSIAVDIQETGGQKRLLARGASIGVNTLGTGVMLGTFMHTGGLTGAEIGVAAATAFLNQKLLGALFGEAAMVELIQRARQRLDGALATTFGEERARFEALVPPSSALSGLATELRDVSADLRALPPGLPADLRAVMDGGVARTGVVDEGTMTEAPATSRS
jgi:energy-coupling factor transporter ATP-binding protein EcfA2